MLQPIEQCTSDAAAVLARYRSLRLMTSKMESATMKHVPHRALLDEGRALGLVEGRTFVVDHEDELAFVFDLMLHAPRSGRSRPIDRYRDAACFPPGSDEAVLLDAICAAAFSIWRIERRHEVVGLVARDLIRGGETWLMDEGMARTMPDGDILATRLARPGPFAMTLGVAVPIDREILEDAMDALPAAVLRTPDGCASDRRFALAVYRAAFEHGAMDTIRFARPSEIPV
jgi:hypothetical protein